MGERMSSLFELCVLEASYQDHGRRIAGTRELWVVMLYGMRLPWILRGIGKAAQPWELALAGRMT